MKRLKKFLKWTAITFLSVCTITLLVVTFLNWRASRALEARLAPLREAGKPVSIADLQPTPVDDSQNAAKAIELLGPVIAQYDRQLAIATSDAETDQSFNVGSIQIARKFVTEQPDLVVKLHEASRLPCFQPDYDFTSDPATLNNEVLAQLGPVRTVARILYGHGLMSLADGKTDAAVRDAIAMLNWSEHLAGQPLLVSYLVSAALYGQATDLAADSLYALDASPEVRSAMMGKIEQSSLAEDFARTLDSERAFNISSLRSFPSSSHFALFGEIPGYLDSFEELESLTKTTTGLLPDSTQTTGTLTGLIWPALQSSVVSFRRSQAKLRALQILAAWQDRGSDTALGIDEIGLAESVTTDPFDGTRMKIKVIGDTIAVYSVGQNLIDDGGNFDEQEQQHDIGVSP